MIKLFPNSTTFITVGPFHVTWYALLIVTGAVISFEIIKREVKKMGYAPESVEDLFLWTLLFGFLGARLWYVVFYDLKMYLAQPERILAIWEGGLAIQGGLVFGGLTIYMYLKKRKISVLRWLDVIAPAVLIAQALGRWGNFVNKEAFGNVVSESFFKFYPAFIKNGMFIDGEYRVPTFLFESVANIIGFFVIAYLLKRILKPKRGHGFYGYLTWYGLTRFFIEGMRTDSLMLFNTGIRMAQLTSIVFVLVGVMGFAGVFKKWTASPKPIILFDFDGTLADTQQSIIEAARHTLETMAPDHVITDADLIAFIGPTLHESFAKYFDDAVIEDAVVHYRTQNRALHHLVTPMPGALHMLQTLQDEGYRMGIVSNKAHHVVQLGLEVTGMTDFFEVVLGYDEFIDVKPDPKGLNMALSEMGVGRDALVYVGDSASDIEAGRRAGGFTIGYVFDTMRKDVLIASQPNRMIDDLEAILEILKEDHEWTYNMM